MGLAKFRQVLFGSNALKRISRKGSKATNVDYVFETSTIATKTTDGTTSAASESKLDNSIISHIVKLRISMKLGKMAELDSSLSREESFDGLVQELVQLLIDAGYDDEFGVTCAMVALEYLEQFIAREEMDKSDELRRCAIATAYCVCFVLATKLLDDNSVQNVNWSVATGVALAEMNRTELCICKALEWKLIVSEESFASQYNSLMCM